MADQATPPKGGQRASRTYQTVLPELGRLLLSQHLPSVDGKVVTVDEFAAVVEKSTELIRSKKLFLQLQIFRPDYVQFLIDREAWETFCGGPTQKEHPNYRRFPVQDPRINNPLPQYFDPGTITPDSYGLIYRDNVHPNCPNCNCGTLATQDDYVNTSLYDDGGTRITTAEGEYVAFKERLEKESRKMGYRDSDERWEKECEIVQAKEDERERRELEERGLAGVEGMEGGVEEMVVNAKDVEGNVLKEDVKDNVKVDVKEKVQVKEDVKMKVQVKDGEGTLVGENAKMMAKIKGKKERKRMQHCITM
ncbi:hypothetical protein SBOR_5464 [Sclerotinia borealis F-4128]|uniref:Uncharacterized protein n=1 Tax=Sclerotinia borealis (strain F-4128) TaxID=1432307 RepID=W9CE62_SCLBF|nr:hypothetical protein SBOR_5464 [Sclerotinia borealis F-4128]